MLGMSSAAASRRLDETMSPASPFPSTLNVAAPDISNSHPQPSFFASQSIMSFDALETSLGLKFRQQKELLSPSLTPPSVTPVSSPTLMTMDSFSTLTPPLFCSPSEASHTPLHIISRRQVIFKPSSSSPEATAKSHHVHFASLFHKHSRRKKPQKKCSPLLPTCCTLPVECWTVVVVMAASSLADVFELSRVSRKVRSACWSPSVKAAVIYKTGIAGLCMSFRAQERIAGKIWRSYLRDGICNDPDRPLDADEQSADVETETLAVSVSSSDAQVSSTSNVDVATATALVPEQSIQTWEASEVLDVLPKVQDQQQGGTIQSNPTTDQETIGDTHHASLTDVQSEPTLVEDDNDQDWEDIPTNEATTDAATQALSSEESERDLAVPTLEHGTWLDSFFSMVKLLRRADALDIVQVLLRKKLLLRRAVLFERMKDEAETNDRSEAVNDREDVEAAWLWENELDESTSRISDENESEGDGDETDDGSSDSSDDSHEDRGSPIERLWTRAAYVAQNADVLRFLLSAGFRTNVTLHDLARRNLRSMMEVFLDLNTVDIDAIEETSEYRAVSVAVQRSSLSAFQCLVERGAKLCEIEQGFTLLHHIRNDGHKLLRYIRDNVPQLRQFVNYPTQNRSGYTPAFYVAREGTPEMLDDLVSMGADLGLFDGSGWSLLHTASHYGNIKIVESLVEKWNMPVDARPAHGDDDTQTLPIDRAEESSHLDIVLYLLRHGSRRALKQFVRMACSLASCELIDLLVEKGFDLNPDEGLYVKVETASKLEHSVDREEHAKESQEPSLTTSPDAVSVTGTDGGDQEVTAASLDNPPAFLPSSPIVLVPAVDAPELEEGAGGSILEQQPQPSASPSVPQDASETLPLEEEPSKPQWLRSRAFQSAFPPDYSGSTEKMGKDDWTALNLAVFYMEPSIVTHLLLVHGCNPNGSTIMGQTPFYSAAGERGNVELAKVLLSHGANFDSRHDATSDEPERPGFSALHRAVQQGFLDAVEFLVALYGGVEVPRNEWSWWEERATQQSMSNLFSLSDGGESADWDGWGDDDESYEAEAARLAAEAAAVGLSACVDATGANPLHVAGELLSGMSGRDHLAILRVLADGRRDWLFAIDGKGRTPLDCAIKAESRETATFLRDRGGRRADGREWDGQWDEKGESEGGQSDWD
ncbi:hypothetical protein DFJ73DRAFT_865593 [Zopfochytrium polystomum]|nr:hypothetical protein DFJ73DRAFT_865593 [Zopfochytrium polystomum]